MARPEDGDLFDAPGQSDIEEVRVAVGIGWIRQLSTAATMTALNSQALRLSDRRKPRAGTRGVPLGGNPSKA